MIAAPTIVPTTRAAAAEQAAAADDHGGDDVELEADGDRRIADRQLRELQHAGERRQARRRAAYTAILVRAIAHAAQARRALVRADREQVAAEARVAQGQRDDQRRARRSARCRTAAAARGRSAPSAADRSATSSAPRCRRSSDSPLAAPRTSSIVPSVTMNGTTRSCVISTPLTSAADRAARRRRRARRRARRCARVVTQQQRDDDRAQRDDRSDRQIDSAGDDDHRHAERRDADDRGLPRHQLEVAPARRTAGR